MIPTKIPPLETPVSRRTLLQSGGIALASTVFIPKIALASHERKLNMYNIHTGEFFKDVFWANGEFIPESLKQLNHFLRDRRNGKTTEMNPKLLTLVHDLSNKLGTSNPIDILCAYRSQATNDKMHREHRGVAKHSKHITGDAVDIKMPGIRLASLRKAAIELKSGGVGYYPKAGFIHVDIRKRPAVWGA